MDENKQDDIDEEVIEPVSEDLKHNKHLILCKKYPCYSDTTYYLQLYLMHKVGGHSVRELEDKLTTTTFSISKSKIATDSVIGEKIFDGLLDLVFKRMLMVTQEMLAKNIFDWLAEGSLLIPLQDFDKWKLARQQYLDKHKEHKE